MPVLHTPAEDLAFFSAHVLRDPAVWVVDAAGIVGFSAFRPGWVDHLYVHPDHHRRGVGRSLLRRAMETEGKLRLWVFQKNTRAIAFYEAQGFKLVKTTDGSGNEEKQPDALYAWERA
ncbi:MAG: GNAT family N-acetyltransferase [Proteobacteria bacterium]|nr:GNAT family N-acetyltransferase [Pseudomonadota bacterium]